MNFLLPKLFAKDSKGKTKIWSISVVGQENGTASIVTTFGYKGGKQQCTADYITEGKNIGRSNETSPYEQAIAEATSKWNRKKDKNYNEFEHAIATRILPMCASRFSERKKSIKYPAKAQPKLNGVRCIAHKISETEIKYTSRTYKEWLYFGHLTPHLLPIMAIGQKFDGEIFNPKFTFQQITNLVKKEKPETKELQFWVYDLAQAHLAFKYRHALLCDAMGHKARSCEENLVSTDFIILNETVDVNSEEEIMKLHEHYRELKFEGTIVRNNDSYYEYGIHSKELQKVKDVQDAEFLIMGAKDEGKGKFKGLCTFICDNGYGSSFDVVPKGTKEERREYFINRDKYIGKMLTVEFEELSEDHKPLKPVGIAVRDYE